jgi:microcystin-dependent protein
MAGFVNRTAFQEHTGAIKQWSTSTAPDGWIICNGDAISRTTYARLFGVIDTTFGVGDGSTTFNVPNFSGVTVKGAGSQNINGRAKDAGSLGAVLEDQEQGHIHYNGLLSNAVEDYFIYGTTTDDVVSTGQTVQSVSSVGSIQGKISTPITDGTNGTPRTGTTTRDSSLAVYFIIKD